MNKIQYAVLYTSFLLIANVLSANETKFGELNNLKIMVGDIGIAYLEAYTQEKVYIVARPEFGDLEGHTLVIHKALYGLRPSGARFHAKLADTLRDMGFQQSKMDSDL